MLFPTGWKYFCIMNNMIFHVGDKIFYSNEQRARWGDAFSKFLHAIRHEHCAHTHFYGLCFCSAAETTQMEDPRQEWRTIQENMLREYLQTAQDALEVSLVLIFSFLSARDNFMLILCVSQQTPWRTLYVSICYGCRNSYSQKYF
jgi:hypothetical protein